MIMWFLIAIIAILGSVCATGALNNNKKVGTPFETDFMSGAFVGNVEKVNTNESYIGSFRDNEHSITYNLTTMDNSSALMEIYKAQGVKGPDHRTYNGNDWNIYFGEAMPNINNTTNINASKSMGIIICESQKESQGYVLYVIFEDLSKVNFTLNTFGDSYVHYIEPLLKTLNLKKSDNVPTVHSQFGLTKEQFNQQIQLIRQMQSGNISK